MDNRLRVKNIFVSKGEPQHEHIHFVLTGESLLKKRTNHSRNTWIELHDGTVHNALSLANWELKIPQYGCQCKKFYAEWKAENAPDFTSPDAFFAWGVRLHNAVNAKLGKSELTIDEARKIWRKSDGCSEDSGSNLP